MVWIGPDLGIRRMMRPFLKAKWVCAGTFAVLAAALPASDNARAADIHLVTENYPPFNFMEDGKIVGVGADQVREIMQREGIEFSLEMMPWPRAYWLAENRKNHCVFTTAMTPARAGSFSWISPLGGAELLLVKKAGTQVPSSITDIAQNSSVGTQRSDYSEYVLQNNGFSNIDYFDDIGAIIRQLTQERLDLAAISSMMFHTLIEQGVDVELVHGFGDIIGNGIACHPDTDQALLGKMQNGLNKIIADGFQLKTLKKYAASSAESAQLSDN